MKFATLLLVLLLFSPAFAEEEKKPVDPVKKLPTALQPGAKAVYDARGSGNRADGTVTFKAEAGPAAGTVRLTVDFDTGDRGVLTMRDRLTAVLDAKSKRIVCFELSVGGKKDEPYVTASRLVMETDPKKKPGPVHERLTWTKKDKPPRVKRTRVKLPAAWVPERLEPFLVPLLGVTDKTSKELTLVNALTGTVLSKPAVYLGLGEGAMKVGKEEVTCRILSRKRADTSYLLYLRGTDSRVVRSSAPTLTLRPEKPTPKKDEKK